jgi:hypothetical protein
MEQAQPGWHTGAENMETAAQLIRRRELLRLGLAGLAASATGLTVVPHGEAAQGEPAAIDGPEEFLTALVRMKGAADGSLSLSWHRGRRYAVDDGRVTPLFGVLAATLFTHTRVHALAFERRSLEIVYYTDLHTGKLLETWDNPFREAPVDVPQSRMGPSLLTVTPTGLTLSGDAPSGPVSTTSTFQPAYILGDKLWITEEITVGNNRESGEAGAFRYNEVNSLSARLADLEGAAASVPSTLQYQSLVLGRSWAGPENEASMQMSVALGGKAAGKNDLPPYWLELTGKHHPEVLRDPLGALDAAP